MDNLVDLLEIAAPAAVKTAPAGGVIDLVEKPAVAARNVARLPTIVLDEDNDDDDGVHDALLNMPMWTIPDHENRKINARKSNNNAAAKGALEILDLDLMETKMPAQGTDAAAAAPATVKRAPNYTIGIDSDDSDDDVKVIEDVAPPFINPFSDDDDVMITNPTMPPPSRKRRRQQQLDNRKPPPGPAPLFQVLEVFPDCDTAHIQKLLKEHANAAPNVVAILAESGYPKAAKSKKQKTNTGRGVVIVQPAEPAKAYKYDYLSPSSFTPSRQYVRQAKRQLRWTDFPFLTTAAIQKHLASAKNHYAIAHQNISNAIMLRKSGSGVPKDEAEQYEQYQRLQKVSIRTITIEQEVALKLKGLEEGRDIVLKRLTKRRSPIPPPEAATKTAGGTHEAAMLEETLAEEIKFVQSKFQKWQSEMEVYARRLKARELAVKNRSAVECSCCFTEVAMEEMVSCQKNGHLFCSDCLKQYAESQIFGSGNLGAVDPKTKQPATELKCFHGDGCLSGFHTTTLESTLPPATMKKYNELQFQAVMAQAGMKDLCTCPKCGYQAELPETEMIFRCPVSSCSHESCRKCGEEPHIPLRCEEVEKKHETKGRLTVEEAISAAKIRTCPRKNCGKKFIKEFGCNKMTCSCGAYVCYICRKEIPRSVGYSHFCQKPHCNHKSCGKCVLNTNDKEDDERAMKEAGVHAAERVREDSLAESGGGDGAAGEVRIDVHEILKNRIQAR